MAVRAQQHAFPSLRANSLERTSDAAQSDVELLLARIDVMKLKRAQPAVVPAQLARAARLTNQNRLDFPPVPGHPLRSTAKTAVVTAVASPRVSRKPVRCALARDERRSISVRQRPQA